MDKREAERKRNDGREVIVQCLANKDRLHPEFRAALRRATRPELARALELRKGVPRERPERRAIYLRYRRLQRKARLAKRRQPTTEQGGTP